MKIHHQDTKNTKKMLLILGVLGVLVVKFLVILHQPIS
jgi:hypothetical protein